MSEKHAPVKGDTVAHEAWLPGDTAVVTAVGERSMLLRRRNGKESETAWSLDTRWIKVEEPRPLPHVWMNTFPFGYISTYYSKAEADDAAAHRVAGSGERRACVHIWTDANGEDQIERVTT